MVVKYRIASRPPATASTLMGWSIATCLSSVRKAIRICMFYSCVRAEFSGVAAELQSVGKLSHTQVYKSSFIWYYIYCSSRLRS